MPGQDHRSYAANMVPPIPPNYLGGPGRCQFESTPQFEALLSRWLPTFGAVGGIRLTAMFGDLCCVPSVSAEDSLAEIAGAARTGKISAARGRKTGRSFENSVVGIVILDHRRQVLLPNHARFEVFNEVEDGNGWAPLF